jgi:GT2 family glycosyltransferase
MVDLSILIVTYNSENAILDCLESVQQHCSPLTTEVLVFDNASTDSTVARVRQKLSQTTVHQGRANLGFSQGNNFLLSKAKGEYVMILNPDAVLLAGAAEKLVDFLKENPKAGAVGPRLVFPDFSYQISCSAYPSLKNEFVTKLYHRALDRNFGPVRSYLEKKYGSRVQVPWVGGACLVCSTEKLLKIGGFDSNFFLYFEDIDLCKRLARQGWHNYHLPEARVMHARGASVRAAPLEKELEYRKSELYYYHKHLSGLSFLSLKLYLWTKFSLAWLIWKASCIVKTDEQDKQKQVFYPKLFKLIAQNKCDF